MTKPTWTTTVALAACLDGCATLRSTSPDVAVDGRLMASRETCDAVDGWFRASATVGTLAGVGAMGSGVGGAATEGTARTVLGISSLTLGVMAGAGALIAEAQARRYVQQCTVDSTGASAVDAALSARRGRPDAAPSTVAPAGTRVVP